MTLMVLGDQSHNGNLFRGEKTSQLQALAKAVLETEQG